jgi:LacI family transcriptional regulator
MAAMVTRKSSVSMKDVAALAGVSMGTVSNVLNSPELVAERTRARVEDAIAKLGWVRNESARQLRAGRSRSVGVVVMDIANPFFTDVVLGVEAAVYQMGYTVQVGNSAQDTARELKHLQLFEQQRVRGILFAPILDVGDRIAQLRRQGIPVVLVDRNNEGADYCSAAVDDVEGGRLAVEHLLDQGCARIAFVGGPKTIPQVRDRLLGAQTAGSGILPRTRFTTFLRPSLDTRAGRAAAEKIADLPAAERPDGVFAANDLLAIGLLQGFVSRGIRVPDDVAIVGYDDIAFAEAAAVPLSSIQQPRQELGRRAAELLFEEVHALDEGRDHIHQHVRFTPTLVARTSSLRRTRVKERTS